jgi:hypothetical protein
MADPSPPRASAELYSAPILEVAAGACVVILLLWGGVSGWRFYNTYLLPGARTVPTATPSPVPDPERARAEARRLRQVLDLVGAGIALRQAGQREGAMRSFAEALRLDPANPDARQNLLEMGVDPAAVVAGAADVPTSTPARPPAASLPTVTPRP